MAISLSDLKKKTNDDTPIIMVYGTAGMGKTSFALDFPEAVYIQIMPERPPAGIESNTFGELNSYSEVMDALRSLAKDKHDFKTVIIDSMDALEPIIWKETCFRNQWKDLEQPGYGKGYLAADHVWREFIFACDWLRRNKGITVIWLALAEATSHEEPGKAPYKRYAMKTHKRAEGLLTQTADAVLFVNTKIDIKETEAGFGSTTRHADGGGMRWLFSDGRPAFVAKNRFLNMPDQLPLPKVNSYESIKQYLPGAIPVAESEPANVAAVEIATKPETETVTETEKEPTNG